MNANFYNPKHTDYAVLPILQPMLAIATKQYETTIWTQATNAPIGIGLPKAAQAREVLLRG